MTTRTPAGARLLRTSAVGAVWLALAAGAVLAQATDPNLDPHYQPAPPDPAGTPASAPAQNPAPAQPAAPAPGVHPATVSTPVDPDAPMVAPPPGWQLVRPVVIEGNLYYAVDDAEAYIAQAGWPYRPVVHAKEDTGFRFDLILVPKSRRDSAVFRRTVGTGMRVSLSSGGLHASWGDGWYWRDDYVANTRGYAGPIDGQLSPGYAPPVPQPEPIILTTMEQAGLALGFGDPEEAIALYRKALEEDPGDTRAVRALGVALLAANRPEDAAATIRYAYVTDPGLAREPLGAWISGDSPRKLRHLLTGMVRHAHSTGSASSWLVVAVLMQAEGRNREALGILDRAAGLEEEVARAMRGALEQR